MRAPAVTVHRDVVYGRPIGFRPLSLDLYLPHETARGLCLYLHGGGWRVGSRVDAPGTARSWSPSFFEQVAGSGLAMASIDYRLSGEASYPAQQQDLAAAAAFLDEHRADYGLSTSRTVAWGVSAGGHLAALHALARGYVPGAAGAVAAVVCWYTPTDLGQLSGDVAAAGGQPDRGPGGRESQLIGAPLDERPDLVEAASPTHHVTGGAPGAPGGPPFLFVHGSADVSVPPRQSHRLADALTAAGGRATVEIVDGATHMFPELDDDATHRIVQRSVQFLLAA